MKIFILILLLLYCGRLSGEISIAELHDNDFDSKIKVSRLSFVYFHADFCPFSRRLEQELKKTALMLNEHHSTESIGIFKIISDENKGLMAKFSVTKFPTIILFKNGRKSDVEYTGLRVSSNLYNLIKEFYFAAPTIIESINELSQDKNHIITVVDNLNSTLAKKIKDYYDELMDKCHFAYMLSNNPNLPPGWQVNSLHSILHDPFDREDRLVGDVNSNTVVFDWVNVMCQPFVHQITHENAQQILSKKKPLFVLFYDETNPDQINQVHEMVAKIKFLFSSEYRDTFVPVIAKYGLFGPALIRISKSQSDLPLFAVDDNSHMYYFGQIDDFLDDYKRNVFIKKYISGDLHSELHNHILEAFQNVVIVFRNIEIDNDNGQAVVGNKLDNRLSDEYKNIRIAVKDPTQSAQPETLNDKIFHEIVKAPSQFRAFDASKYRYTLKKDEL